MASVGKCHEISKTPDIIYLPDLFRRATWVQLQSLSLALNFYLAVFLSSHSLLSIHSVCLCITSKCVYVVFVSLLEL